MLYGAIRRLSDMLVNSHVLTLGIYLKVLCEYLRTYCSFLYTAVWLYPYLLVAITTYSPTYILPPEIGQKKKSLAANLETYSKPLGFWFAYTIFVRSQRWHTLNDDKYTILLSK